MIIKEQLITKKIRRKLKNNVSKVYENKPMINSKLLKNKTILVIHKRENDKSQININVDLTNFSIVAYILSGFNHDIYNIRSSEKSF